MTRGFKLLVLMLLCSFVIAAAQTRWRSATSQELARIVPARAAVEKERIETEMRTASGVTDGRGRFIYGVVLITAGYSAEGKYSHYFVTQPHIKVNDIDLKAGEYVFGFHRKDADTLAVSFYQAASGKEVGVVIAKRQETAKRPIQSFEIDPSSNTGGTVRLGRFAMEYTILP
ncbi:MAG: hypothetical protein NVS9B15_17210 [Acidobacteriaceae bacterium]